MTSVIIVDKTGTLKSLTIKEYKEEDLYKKCGFKKADGFSKRTEWTVKMQGQKYFVSVYGKIEGKANSENKYDFPPPIDSILFFGSCLIVAREEGSDNFGLTIELWNKIYEKLFGGFEDLIATAAEDENEVDELANIPKDKKTKQGYLKDGFVVDSSDTDNDENPDGSESDYDSDGNGKNDTNKSDSSEDLDVEDIGSELDEEDYDYE